MPSEDFFVTDMDEIVKEQERKLEELSKNPPKDVNFTYSKEQLEKVINDFRTDLERRKNGVKTSNSTGRVIEDYAEEWEYHYEPQPSEIVNLVESFNRIPDKNNIENVEYIVSQINSKYNDRMSLPNEITKTVGEIKEHLNYLYQIRDINRYNEKKQTENLQTQQEQSELLRQQEQQIQQERSRLIQGKLPLINDKLNYLRELSNNNEILKSRMNDLLKERLYFYHKVNLSAEDLMNGKTKDISQEDMERLNSYLSTLDSIEREIINSHKQTQQTTQVQEETYVTLEQLEPLLSESGYMCYGHGTGRKGNSDEVVDSIFNEGLRTKNNSLYYTTIGLSTPTPELKEQFKEIGMPEPTIEDLKEQFNNWQHQDSKKIIIARVPTEYINKAGDRSDLDGEMFGAFYTQKQQPNGQATNYLDSKFIIGCFDVEKQAVRLNKNFERTLTPETIEQLKENYKKTVEKTNARKERQTMGITQEEINLAQQSQEPVVNYNADSYDNFEDIDWGDTPLKPEQPKQEQEQINQLKEQISNYNSQIDMLIANMQPYMQIPKVNREISKVIEKNNEINSSQIIDSLNDYKTVAEIKQSLLTYLGQANKFINDNVGKKQEPVVEQQVQESPTDVLNDSNTWGWLNEEKQQVQESVQSQTTTQSLSDEDWKNLFTPQEKQISTNQSFEEIMADFKNPDPTARPERMYNSDGTYTMEYIAHIANTPLGFNKTIYDQLMQENEMKRRQNEEQMSSGGRHM